MQLSRRAFFAPRRGSLPVATAVVLGSLAAAVWISNFPQNRATLWLIVPVLVACAATLETIRSMRRRWDFHHAGVVLLLYMDIMAMAMILFLLIYPFAQTWSF